MSSLSYCSDAYILVKGTISIEAQAGDKPNNPNKKVVYKNCAPFTDCISKTNNTQIDNAKIIDALVPMYNLIEYSDNYSKRSGSIWQYYGDEPALTLAIADTLDADNSALLKFKQKITGVTGNNGTKDIEIIEPFKFLSNF